jgi:hypothetical protein
MRNRQRAITETLEFLVGHSRSIEEYQHKLAMDEFNPLRD